MNEILEFCRLNVKHQKNYFSLLNINLQFDSSFNYLILGEEESGKSTLARMIAGLEKKYNGEIKYNNELIDTNHSFFKNQIGMIFDSGVFFENKTVLKNLEYAFYIRNDKDTRTDFEQILANFELSGKENVKIKKLSKYDRIMLCLARLSLRKFTFLVLDEIFDELSSEQVGSIFEKIKLIDFQSLIITDKTDRCLKYADFRIVKLKSGFLANN